MDIGLQDFVNASNIFDLPERCDTFIIVIFILIKIIFFVYRYIEFPVLATRCKLYEIVPKDPPIVVRGKKQYWYPKAIFEVQKYREN